MTCLGPCAAVSDWEASRSFLKAQVSAVALVIVILVARATGQAPGTADPFAQIIGSTYLGGVDDDCPFDATVAPDGTIVLVGTTYSPNLPVTTDAFDTEFSSSGLGIGDAFVARIDPASGIILACTYLGGSAGEEARVVVVDPSNNVYCGGYTTSTDFPVTRGAYSTRKKGISDFFVARLDADLSQVEAATLIGGDMIEASFVAMALATENPDSLVLATRVESQNMPVTQGAFDTDLSGLSDVWIGSLTLDLATLVFGTFVGGNDSLALDAVTAMVVDMDGSIVFAGGNAAPDFPQTIAPWPTATDGKTYVARLSADGSQLLASGFIGGSNGDWIAAIAIDAAGNVYLAGGTWSDDFPVTDGVYDPTPGTLFQDGILFCLAPDLRTLLRSTYSGLATKDIQSMVIDSTGSPTYVTNTNSGGFVGSLGAWNQFAQPLTSDNWLIIRLDPDFRELLHGTYLGGSEAEEVAVILPGASGRVVVAGCTESVDYPVTPGASQTTNASPFDSDGVITLYSMLPKGMARFGSPTSGCTGEVVAGATQSASVEAGWLGITCTGAPPSSDEGLLAIALSGLDQPVLAKGVAVWVSPSSLVALLPVMSGESGFARIDLHLPAGAGLLGLQVAAQYFWQDPCGPSGWTASDALWIVVVD